MIIYVAFVWSKSVGSYFMFYNIPRIAQNMTILVYEVVFLSAAVQKYVKKEIYVMEENKI